MTRPGLLLRLEGAAVIVLTLLFYRELGASWARFALLILLPDLSLLAYFAGKNVGATAYNVVHTLALPAALYAVGFLTARAPIMGIALIWAAHIGADRLLGLGLKYPTTFRDTHLQRVR